MSKAESSSTNQPTKEDVIPGLGVLEEDDEFEEFPVQGEYVRVPNFRTVSYASSTARSARRYTLKPLDWDDSQTDLANLGGPGAAGSAAAGDKLWEDNWDDDDIEEEFSTQLRSFILSHSTFALRLKYHPFLRSELEKTKTSSDAMQH
jgi:26 proteasome complex subunit DSS1